MHTEPKPRLTRGFGLLDATALNMSNMVGVGPFITIPLLMASMGGPQAMIGWLTGAVLVICDGLRVVQRSCNCARRKTQLSH